MLYPVHFISLLNVSLVSNRCAILLSPHFFGTEVYMKQPNLGQDEEARA